MKPAKLLTLCALGASCVSAGAQTAAPVGTAEDEALWKTLDINADDWLDGIELDGGWKRFDSDGNAEVTKAEWLRGRAAERGQGAGNAKDDERLFNQLDISGNGYLTGTELNGANARSFDANGDKVVTLEEFLAGRARERGAAAPAAKSPAKATAPQPAPAATRPLARPAIQNAAMPAPVVMSTSKINGLFYMQKYWFATRHLEQSTWYFAPDGKVYCDLTTGFSPADLAASKGHKGTYRIANGQLSIAWDGGQKSENDIELADGGWNFDTGLYVPVEPFKDASQLPGSYEGGTSVSFAGSSTAVSKSLELRADGTYAWGGIATFRNDAGTTGGGQGTTSGKWTLSGYTLTLTENDGKVVSGIIFPFDDKKTPIYPDRMFFAGTMYKKR